MRIDKNRVRTRARNRRVMAAEESVVDVAPEAVDLLFEADDVAQLVAEVTGEPVEVNVDDEAVTFTVGENEFKVEPEGNEEVLESCRRNVRGKAPVRSARRTARRRPVSASARARRTRTVGTSARARRTRVSR